MERLISEPLSWLLTGPVAFLIAGALDLLSFAAASLRARLQAFR